MRKNCDSKTFLMNCSILSTPENIPARAGGDCGYGYKASA
jgi:hypothetical protein